MRPPAVIGVGNEFRGDDAAGLLVIRALRAAGVACSWDLLEHSGEGAGLIDTWENRSRVVLVDAVAAAEVAAGTVLRYDDPGALNGQQAELRCSSHAFGVGAALALAAELNRLPASLIVYGIAGIAFAQGAPMSPAVARAVVEVMREIRTQEWRHDA